MSRSSLPGSPLEFGVVIPSGGRGVRAARQSPKQFCEIAGVPMLLRAIRPFAAHTRVSQIVVALPPSHVDAPPDWLGELVGDRLRLVAGGATRAESVRRGVSALDPALSGVLVHDAVRPFVSRETIDAVMAAVDAGMCATAAVPVSDTIKRVAESSTRILETLDRSHLWRAQTPQGFTREILVRAYDVVGSKFEDNGPTDEASLVEVAGFPVCVVPDSPDNIKITTPVDFVVAEAMAVQ